MQRTYVRKWSLHLLSNRYKKMNIDEVRHDFINNALRIETLNKLICEKLEKNEQPLTEYVEDLKKFLTDHIQMLNKK